MSMSASKAAAALVVLIVLSALLLPAYAAGAAEAPPSPPCRFYGTVLLDGQPVPNGTVITITVATDNWTTTPPGLVDGMSYDEGTPVAFAVAGYEAPQRGYWETGGNVRVDLAAWIPLVPPTPEPSPTPTVAPTPTPPPSPTPMPTVPPGPGPDGPGAADTTNSLNTVIVALCVGILIVCAMFAAYLIWKYRIRRGPPRGGRPRPVAPRATPTGEASETEATGWQETASTESMGEQVEPFDAIAAAGLSLRWQDRLMLKMMSNRIIIKIFSNPIVMKVITWEMKAFIAISSLFRRR